jgi:hypothetical protein
MWVCGFCGERLAPDKVSRLGGGIKAWPRRLRSAVDRGVSRAEKEKRGGRGWVWGGIE